MIRSTYWALAVFSVILSSQSLPYISGNSYMQNDGPAVAPANPLNPYAINPMSIPGSDAQPMTISASQPNAFLQNSNAPPKTNLMPVYPVDKSSNDAENSPPVLRIPITPIAKPSPQQPLDAPVKPIAEVPHAGHPRANQPIFAYTHPTQVYAPPAPSNIPSTPTQPNSVYKAIETLVHNAPLNQVSVSYIRVQAATPIPAPTIPILTKLPIVLITAPITPKPPTAMPQDNRHFFTDAPVQGYKLNDDRAAPPQSDYPMHLLDPQYHNPDFIFTNHDSLSYDDIFSNDDESVYFENDNRHFQDFRSHHGEPHTPRGQKLPSWKDDLLNPDELIVCVVNDPLSSTFLNYDASSSPRGIEMALLESMADMLNLGIRTRKVSLKDVEAGLSTCDIAAGGFILDQLSLTYSAKTMTTSNTLIALKRHILESNTDKIGVLVMTNEFDRRKLKVFTSQKEIMDALINKSISAVFQNRDENRVLLNGIKDMTLTKTVQVDRAFVLDPSSKLLNSVLNNAIDVLNS